MKGLGTLGIAIVVVLVAVVALGGVIGLVGLTARVPVTPSIDYDGEFDDAGVPDEVSGTDLQVEVAYAEDDDNASITMNTTTIFNSTANAVNGQTFYLATMFEFDGPVKELEIEGEMASGVTDDVETRKVYIVPNEEGISLEADDAVSWGRSQLFEVDSDMEDFDAELGPITNDGEYILVIEMKATAVDDDDSGADLYDVTLELDTEEDREELVIDVNAG